MVAAGRIGADAGSLMPQACGLACASTSLPQGQQVEGGERRRYAQPVTAAPPVTGRPQAYQSPLRRSACQSRLGGRLGEQDVALREAVHALEEVVQVLAAHHLGPAQETLQHLTAEPLDARRSEEHTSEL